MPHDAAAHYAEMVEATVLQRTRLHGDVDLPRRWERVAPAFRFDPLRSLEKNVEVVASYVEPADTVIDVGGGAGRVGLPLARRCASVTNVEPSHAMGEQFLASAADAGIDNVRLLQTSWPASQELTADVVMSADVVYFVPDIVPFVSALGSSAERTVVLWIWSVPPPNRHAALFELVYGEPKAPVPGHRELLPVLWDMGIVPNVRVLPEPFAWPEALPRTRAEAIKFALEAVEAPQSDAATERVEAAFEKLFRPAAGVYEPTWRPRAEGLLITWEPSS